MNRLMILAPIMALISACASAPYRTGTIAINKFRIDGYKTNNYVDIKQDVAERMRDELYRSIILKIPDHTKMTVADGCSTADYEITGRFNKINSELDSHWRLVTITVNREYEVELDVELKDCKTGKSVIAFDPDRKDKNMDSMIDNLADDITSKIKKDRSAKITTP